MEQNTVQQHDNLTYYASIISGILLFISEAMPYISKVKGNGIIQVLANSFTKYEETKQKEEDNVKQKLDLIMKRLETIEDTLKKTTPLNLN